MHQDKVAFLWFCDNRKWKRGTTNFICHHLFMLFSFSDPTDSVPVYLLLLNLLFIFLLCCPHSLHCLTWSSPLSTIKSCCHQGDFSILGTTAGSRLCLAPHSFPNWLHYCCEKPMHKLIWLLGRLHLWYQHLQVNYWADISPSVISCMIFCVGPAVLGWLDMHYIVCTALFLHVFPFIPYHEVYCLLRFIPWSLLTSYLSEMEFTCMGSGFRAMNITKNHRQTCQCFVTQN